MNIACLGWGSLIWDPRDIPIQRYWFNDGPLLPIEFARHSTKDRMTAVIVPGVRRVRSLWAIMTVNDVDAARKSLAEREGVREATMTHYIGSWSAARADDRKAAPEVGEWASQIGLDAVVWTALPAKFEGIEGKVPTADQVMAFLKNLSTANSCAAEEYVRMAPRQVDTDYRRRMEEELRWKPFLEG